MPLEVDVAVVGAGVVGLAAAAALAAAGRTVLVLERGDRVAAEVTSRNSEIVHAGLYYPEGSLKATLCRRGRELLYARCAARRIPHRRLGKLVVATQPGEEAVLERLQTLGTANGAPGLALLDRADARALEPALTLNLRAALHSPDTGIVDAAAFAESFQIEAEQHGAQVLLQTEVVALERTASGWRVEVRRPGAEVEVAMAAAVVNAAGLSSDALAAAAGLDVDACGYRLHYCKGDYFTLAPGFAVSLRHLVYPVPTEAGLGVHATLDLGGRVRFGPDTEYVSSPRYDVDAAKASTFAAAVQRYLPDVAADWLVPDYAGVRPKLAAPGEGFRDFAVREESAAGLPGLVNCIGIESPGLTAAPAIAERVSELLASL